MSESSKSSKPFWVVVILILTQFVFVVSLVSKDTIEGSIKQELSYMIDTFGYEKTAQIYEKAVDSTAANSGGLYQLKKLLLPEEFLSTGQVSDRNTFNTKFWMTVEGAIDNLSLNLEFFLLRVYALSPWAILSLVILSAAGMTGYLLREIKKQGFEYSSPLRHGLAKKGLYYMPLLAYLFFMIPIAIPPIAFPVLIGLVGLSVTLILSNTMKRV